MEKSPPKSLTGFVAHDKPFPERLINALFKIEYTGIRKGALKEVFTTGSYVPEMPDIKAWAESVLEYWGYKKPEAFEDYDFLEKIFHDHIIPYKLGDLDLIEAKSGAIRDAKLYYAGSARELMFGDGPTNEAWFAAHAYMFCNNVEHEMVNRLRGVNDDIVTRNGQVTYEEYLESCAFCTEVGIAMGFLRRDAWWKFNHEQAAIAHYEQIDARQRGSSKGGDANASRYERLKQDCLAYIPKAYREHGVVVLGGRADTVAKIIREIALRERPDDFVGPRGKPLALKWFIEAIEDFQSNGKLGKAIETLLQSKA